MGDTGQPVHPSLDVGSCYGGEISFQGKILWASIPHVTVWILWVDRNVIIFYKIVWKSQKDEALVFALLFQWVSHLPLFKEVKFHKWVFD